MIILTSKSNGSAAYQLKEIVKSRKIKVCAVVLSRGRIVNKRRFYKRKLRKILKIGVLGAINGIRMRKWYSDGVTRYLTFDSIEKLCELNNIPLHVTPLINCPDTVKYFTNANAQLGLSLGNGYIGSRIFSIPKFGMLNIHHEELPAYQNAQSIIWQLYNGSINTGYTIHKINKHIDQGEILYQEKVPIVFRESLADTVSYNYAELWKRSAEGLIRVLEDFENFFVNSKKQGSGQSYTTPSLSQYFRIKRNFSRLKKVQGSG